MTTDTQKIDVLDVLDRVWNRIPLTNVHQVGFANEVAEVRSIVADLIDATNALNSNKYLDLGNLVYEVRERECEGWDGPSVVKWSDAVTKLRKALERIA